MKNLILSTLLLLSMGCDQEVDEGDDMLTEGNQSLEVTYNGSSQTVHFDNLETLTMFGDSPVVSVADVVLGSGMLASPSALQDIWLNFVGTDDYTPYGNDNCLSDYLPTSGADAEMVFIERGTCNILWDESIDIENCLIVKEVGTIQIADTEDGFGEGDADSDTDTDDDAGPPPDHVDVEYGGETETVILADIEISSLDDVDVRMLSAVIDAAGMDIDLENVLLSFEGDDGYNPTVEGTCTEALPVAGTLVPQAGIESETGDLYWESTLEFPGCAHVKRVAVIYVEDL